MSMPVGPWSHVAQRGRRCATILNVMAIWTLVLFPVEVLLATLCPAFQIFGPNVWRDNIASCFRPVLGDSAWHFAGALTDFKKLPVYLACLFQVAITKIILQTRTTNIFSPFSWRDGARFLLRRRRSAINDNHKRCRFSYRRIVAFWLGTILATSVVSLGLFIYLWLWIPARTVDHVFGPVGKGLISSFWHPDLSLDGHITLIAYRLWYLLSLLPVMVFAAHCLFVSVTLVGRRLPQGERIGSIASIWTFLFVGVAYFLHVSLTWLASMSARYGIGEVGGPTQLAVYVGTAFSSIWLILALVLFATVLRTSDKGFSPGIRTLAPILGAIMTLWGAWTTFGLWAALVVLVVWLIGLVLLYRRLSRRLELIGRWTLTITLIVFSATALYSMVERGRQKAISAVVVRELPRARWLEVRDRLGGFFGWRERNVARVESRLNGTLGHLSLDRRVATVYHALCCLALPRTRHSMSLGYDEDVLRGRRRFELQDLAKNLHELSQANGLSTLFPADSAIPIPIIDPDVMHALAILQLELAKYDSGCRASLLGLTSYPFIRFLIVVVGAYFLIRWYARIRVHRNR